MFEHVACLHLYHDFIISLPLRCVCFSTVINDCYVHRAVAVGSSEERHLSHFCPPNTNRTGCSAERCAAVHILLDGLFSHVLILFLLDAKDKDKPNLYLHLNLDKSLVSRTNTTIYLLSRVDKLLQQMFVKKKPLA